MARPEPDTTAPAITCPPDVTVASVADIPPADFAGGSVSDDQDPNPNVVGVLDAFEASGCEATADGNALVIDYNGIGGAGGMRDNVDGHLINNLDTKLLPQTTSCYLLQVTVMDLSTGESLSETVPLQAK